MATGLRLNVAELLRRPGTTKDVHVEAVASDVGVLDARVSGDAVVAADLHVDSLSDGLTVTGVVTAPWHDSCRRCLADIDEVVCVEVRELFQLTITDPDAFPIVGDQIDFTEVLRDAVQLELPIAALCRDDCPGICATCGADLNDGPCSCDGPPPDPRWSALDSLKDRL